MSVTVVVIVKSGDKTLKRRWKFWASTPFGCTERQLLSMASLSPSLCLCLCVLCCCGGRGCGCGCGGERREGERLIEPSGCWFSQSFPQDCCNWTAFSGKANEWRNREHVVLDLFSNFKCTRSKGFFGEPLWGQVLTLRGQILVSGTGDATLRVLCCALCVLVCNVLVLVLVCHADPSPLHPPRTHSSPRVYVQNAHRVHTQNVPVCAGTTPASGNTCGRGPSTHGDVLNVHTGVFQRATPHHTQTPRPQRHTRHNNNHHSNTGTDRDRQGQRQRETEKEWQDKTRREKTRQDNKKAREDEREETRQEKKISRKEKREERRDKRWKEEKRWKWKWRDIEMKRNERKDVFFFFQKKCFKTLKSARWISSKCFEKIPLGRIIPPFFFESSEADRVINYLHDSNSIFRAAGINSEIVFGRTVFVSRRKRLL